MYRYNTRVTYENSDNSRIHDLAFFRMLQQDCPNGRLTPAKFVDMYKMFFPSGNAEEFCDHVFRTFDMDKNGYIDFKVSPRGVSYKTRIGADCCNEPCNDYRVTGGSSREDMRRTTYSYVDHSA